jgi:hypothetical protein
MKDISFTKALICPWCDAVLNSGRVIATNSRNEKDFQPKPGHLGVCHFCAQIIAFDQDMTLARVTDDDMKMLQGLSAELVDHLERLQEVTRSSDRQNLPQPNAQPKAKPDCYKCGFRRALRGSGHSRCGHPTAIAIAEHAPAGLLLGEFTGGPPIAPEVMGVELHRIGIERGWATWPLNYDPVWLRACKGFIPK